jgi:hypothetical protein
MSDAFDPHPEHGHDSRHTVDDLRALRSHPSLAGLSARGRDLDRLPVVPTAWAFVVATASSLLLLGYVGAVVVTLGTTVGAALTASALLNRDVAAARAVLRTTAGGLTGWILLIAVVVRP